MKKVSKTMTGYYCGEGKPIQSTFRGYRKLTSPSVCLSQNCNMPKYCKKVRVTVTVEEIK